MGAKAYASAESAAAAAADLKGEVDRFVERVRARGASSIALAFTLHAAACDVALIDLRTPERLSRWLHDAARAEVDRASSARLQ